MPKNERLPNVRIELREILLEFFRAFMAMLLCFLCVAFLIFLFGCQTSSKKKWQRAADDIYEFDLPKKRLYTDYMGRRYYISYGDMRLRDLSCTDSDYMWDLIYFKDK